MVVKEPPVRGFAVETGEAGLPPEGAGALVNKGSQELPGLPAGAARA